MGMSERYPSLKQRLGGAFTKLFRGDCSGDWPCAWGKPDVFAVGVAICSGDGVKEGK